MSEIFVKKHSPETTYFVKKHKNSHPRAGELCQMYEKQKSFFQSTPRNQIVINTKTQLMREQEANILLLLSSIKYNMLSFHSGDIGQTARPREREKSNIRTQGQVHKVKSHSSGMNALSKSPPPPPPITLIGA